MPIKKWIIQYLIATPVVAMLLGGIQMLKGRELEYAVEFGLLWGVISTTIFIATRIYYYKKGLYCKVCNDLPKPERSQGDEGS